MRRAAIGLGLALALRALAPAPPAAAAPPARRVPVVHHRERSFRIPFQPLNPQDRARLKEVQLWVSEDSGYTWRAVSRTTPDRPTFTFRAPRDAEYWFAVRTLDVRNRLYPVEDAEVAPDMKVVVDTSPPSVILEPEPRRGSVVEVRWEVRDDHIDLASLTLEYQIQGETDWRQAPVRRPGLIGAQKWDAGTYGPIRVRLGVQDHARNAAERTMVIPAASGQLAGGGPAMPGYGSEDVPFAMPGPGPDRPAFAPVAAPAGRRDLDHEVPPEPGPDPLADPLDPEFHGAPAPLASSSPTMPPEPTPSPDPDPAPAPIAADPGQGPAHASPTTPGTAPGAAGPGGGQTMLVASPRFALKYEVDDAGPGGPASVALWVTQDGGRTWSRRDEDPDRRSPYHVDLGGEGTFGLSLVARGASGLGDPPPAPGDPPQMWVEVDTTPPQVQLEPPQAGTGAEAGRVAITWRATDLHLADRPVLISYRPDQPGARWVPITQRIENTGKFTWVVPPGVPPRFHIRLDVVDRLGNRGSAETTTMGPVIVDRTRPRSRIVGLDPNAPAPR